MSTLDSLLVTGTECSIGVFTFKDFHWTSTGSVVVDPANVNVAPSTDPNTFGLIFTSSYFTVSGEQSIRELLEYTIDPPPVIIDGFRLSMRSFSFGTGSINALNDIDPLGTATVTTDLCVGDLFVNNCIGGYGTFVKVFDYGGGIGIPSDTANFAAVNLVDVRTTIELFGNGDGFVQFDGFEQGATSSVPEPAAIGLMAGGLLALAGMKRFLAKVRK